MPSISATIDIVAPPDAVWEVLTDYARYPEWNPFIVEMSGDKRGLSVTLYGHSPTERLE